MNQEILRFVQLMVTGLVIGSVYALVALGFVLIYKATGVLNFAQGELFMVGGYVCLALIVEFHIPFVAAFLMTMVFSAIMAIVFERVMLRPMIGEPIISVIMLTIGLSSVLRAVVQAIWSTDTRVYPPVFSEEPLQLGGIVVSQVYLYSFFFAVLFLVIFRLFFKYSRAGIAMRATAADQQVAQSMGISVKRIFALAWCISTVVSATGGILLGNINGINSGMAFIGLKAIPCVILGGLDSLLGAVIGGITVGVLENLSGGYLDPLVGGGVKEVAPFVILVLILMIKPYGLFGTVEIERI
jgi:branched-chain amino acid transport system permease protein